MQRKIFTYGLILGAALLLNTPVNAQSKEQVIAAYLEKIANYIKWNEEKVLEDNVFTIAVIGDLYMCDIIKDAYQNRAIKGMTVEVVCLKKVVPQPNIDLLFLATNKLKELELAIELCKKEKFLLVTDAISFAEKGSHINFYLTENQTLHFEMNKSTLDSNGFEVDFFLLDFAKIVEY